MIRGLLTALDFLKCQTSTNRATSLPRSGRIGKSNHMTEEISPKLALVTGAGRGIGRAIAETLAREGMEVICVSKSAESCGGAAEAIRASGGVAEAMAVDVAHS